MYYVIERSPTEENYVLGVFDTIEGANRCIDKELINNNPCDYYIAQIIK